MPVYEKGKNRWRVRIWHKGKRQDWIVEGKKADAEAFEARQRVALEQGDPVPSRTAPTFSDFCLTRYRPHAEQQLRASTWKVRKYQLATLNEHLGSLKLPDVTTETVETYKAKRRKQGAKPRTINNELAVLQAVRTYARKLGVPTANATIEPLPVIGRGRVTFWSDEQVATLYESVRTYSPEILPVVVFLANTGCRKGEALALEWRCVDLKRRIVTIEPNEEWQPKDNEPREIKISDALLPWLSGARKSERWVFPSSATDEHGRPTRYAYWPKLAFDRARDLAGHRPSCALLAPKPKGGRGHHAPPAPKCTCGVVGLRGGPHTLRHTFATHFLRAVSDLYLLAKVLGHSHERTTKLYSHLLPDHLARSLNAVNLAPSIGPAALQAQVRWAQNRT